LVLGVEVEEEEEEEILVFSRPTQTLTWTLFNRQLRAKRIGRSFFMIWYVYSCSMPPMHSLQFE